MPGQAVEAGQADRQDRDPRRTRRQATTRPEPEPSVGTASSNCAVRGPHRQRRAGRPGGHLRHELPDIGPVQVDHHHVTVPLRSALRSSGSMPAYPIATRRPSRENAATVGEPGFSGRKRDEPVSRSASVRSHPVAQEAGDEHHLPVVGAEHPGRPPDHPVRGSRARVLQLEHPAARAVEGPDQQPVRGVADQVERARLGPPPEHGARSARTRSACTARCRPGRRSPRPARSRPAAEGRPAPVPPQPPCRSGPTATARDRSR